MTRPHRRPAGLALVAVLLAMAGLAVPGRALAQEAFRDRQHGLEQMGAEQAWATSRGDGIVIAVVDSGVDLGHPDLVDRVLRDADGRVVGRDFVDDDGDPSDALGHGTLVAGIAAATADDDLGIAGVAPRAMILPVRVLDDEGRGSLRRIDEAVRWAVDNGADVVNLSLEGEAAAGGPTGVQAPTAAVDYAWERGVVVVAAAGNDGGALTDYAASSPVLLVGATGVDGALADFSDTGRRDGLLAPGTGIVSTWCRAGDGAACDGVTHTYGMADGTSFAAPHVAGAVAVLLAAGASPEDAVGALRATAVDLGPPGPDDATGHGRVDLEAAVERVTRAAEGGAGQDEDAQDRTVGGASATDPTPPPDREPSSGVVVTTPDATVAPAPLAASPAGAGSATPEGLRFLAGLVLLATVAAVTTTARRRPRTPS